VRLFHSLAKTHASFDDPDLVSHAGLVPVMALAQRAGLGDLVAEHVTPGGECGVNAHLKVPCLAAGMAAGADSVDDMDLLRHGATGVLFGGIRAPAALGSHLRSEYLGRRRAAGEGGPGVPGQARRAGAAAARRRRAGVHRYRLDAETRLRLSGTRSTARSSGTRRIRGNRSRSEPKVTFRRAF
jgi:hypothetical protein